MPSLWLLQSKVICDFVLQWWEPLHVAAESGPKERSHSAGAGRHRTQDPGSFPASRRAHQCYGGPGVCKPVLLKFSLNITPKRGDLNVIIVDKLIGRAVYNHIKRDLASRELIHL